MFAFLTSHIRKARSVVGFRLNLAVLALFGALFAPTGAHADSLLAPAVDSAQSLWRDNKAAIVAFGILSIVIGIFIHFLRLGRKAAPGGGR